MGAERIILIVDDEDKVREALSAVLLRDGYQVLLAEDATEALQILAEKNVHLVISDHHMPGMSGLQLLSLIRDRHPDVTRMMLSGDPDNHVVTRSIREGGVFWFLRKPWDNNVLRTTAYLAFQRRELEADNRRLSAACERQAGFLEELATESPALAPRLREEADKLRAAQPEPRG